MNREALGGTLVLGVGFACAYVARLLGTRGCTIVSPQNSMLYTPLLPEAAYGTLEPRHVVMPLRQMCPHAEETPGRTDPPTCQHALRQARRLAANLTGTPEPSGYRTLGQVATLGRFKGIADVLGIHLPGFPGWFVAWSYHPYALPPLSRRLRVAADWTTALLFPRDIAELSSLGQPEGFEE